uniref:peroxidase n=1 Tax=Tanacetum cinerariifolium TaxID=118510 RepID=A0A6L2NXC6_TANCI|nr:hypothetical protein [Tanacetum cinerariifolium]
MGRVGPQPFHLPPNLSHQKKDLHPELPGPEERIVDFPEGKVKIGTRPRAAHEVLLLTVTTNRVIEMEDSAAATYSFGIPSTIERSPLDFVNENPSQPSTGGDRTEDQGQETVAPKVPPSENVTNTRVAPETSLVEEISAMGPRVIKEHRKKRNDGVDANAPPMVLRKDHADSRSTPSTIGGKSHASMGLETGSTFPVPTPKKTPADVSDPNPLSFANPQSILKENVVQSSKGAVVAGDPESENTSFTSMVGSPESIYQPGWGVTNGYRLDTSKACQDLVDHIAPPGYFSKMRHLHNDDFLRQYNINLARQVAMGSQLRLRFEHEAKLLKKSVAQVGRRDQRIQARENEIKNLEALLEAETDMKKATEAKNAELVKELENLRALFTDLQVSNDRLSQQRCAEIDARLDALSIDFDKELYLHMLTAIAGRRWVIGHGLRLAVMKCGESTELRQVIADVVSAGIAKGMSEGLKYEVVRGKANLDSKAIEAYDPKADTKYVIALHALRDLKYPMVRDHKDSWSFKEEILLVDAIAANVSRAEKKNKCRVVCRTYGVGSAHHARSDGVPVSVLTVAPQGLAILLADATTQTETSEDKASPRICTCGVSCAPWESSRMHLTS